MKKKENIDKESEEDVLKDTTSEENTDNNSSEKKSKSKKAKKDKKEQKFDELQEKYNELNDKYLRLYSDFDNFRKRKAKEFADIIKTANKETIIDLLPVLDDFERAVQAMKDHNADEESIKGTDLIFNKLFNLLKQKGLKPMDSMGKEFDTDWHEAITNIPAPSKDLKGKVVDVIQKGYLLNDTIIRYAKVVVGN